MKTVLVHYREFTSSNFTLPIEEQPLKSKIVMVKSLLELNEMFTFIEDIKQLEKPEKQ